jgi:A/G-specific adenine glycosylase
VVRIWSGLGYNRRALNLHRAAVLLVAEHGGRVPDDEATLRRLPGIGPYTARAVLAFAFERDVAPVDTNVIRILARCVTGSGLALEGAQVVADRLVPAGQSWAFNQTMFDLGATVCTARPLCDLCPVRRQCRWYASGLVEPDPWRASPSVRSQSVFASSDRQGRGRLLEALRQGPLAPSDIGRACGWPDDEARAERICAALVREGFAEWKPAHARMLHLR